MSHKKTWECSNPCGDGCDGKHEQTPDIREKARAIVLKWQTTTPSQLVDDIATAIQDERDAALEEAAKLVHEEASEALSVTVRAWLFNTAARIRKLKGDAS